MSIIAFFIRHNLRAPSGICPLCNKSWSPQLLLFNGQSQFPLRSQVCPRCLPSTKTLKLLLFAAAHVSFAMDVTDISSSSCSDKTSSGANATAATKLSTRPVTVEVQPPQNNHVVQQRCSAASTITSDYFSMKDATSVQQRMQQPKVFLAQHHNGGGQLPPPPVVPILQEPQIPRPEFIPPPPPQYDSRPLCDIEAELCRKLSCSGHTCHSQDSLNSAYTDDDIEEEDEDVEEEEERGYYHIMPRKSEVAPESCDPCVESHSCQTYEDHATQTEDEESDAENGKEANAFPPYGECCQQKFCQTASTLDGQCDYWKSKIPQ